MESHFEKAMEEEGATIAIINHEYSRELDKKHARRAYSTGNGSNIVQRLENLTFSASLINGVDGSPCSIATASLKELTMRFECQFVSKLFSHRDCRGD